MMDDKLLDELLSIQVPAPVDFVAMKMNNMDISVDHRELFEDILLHAGEQSLLPIMYSIY